VKINSIRNKIILYIFIGITLCAIVSTLIVIDVVNNQLTRNYKLNNDAATDALSYTLPPILAIYDYNQVEQIIKSFLIYQNIATISVFGEDGTLIRSATEQNIHPEDLEIQKRDITSNNVKIGSFQIVLSRTYINEQISTTVGALIFGLVGFLALLGLALFIFINRSIIKPIETFKATVDQITPEHLFEPVDIKRDDEIGMLAKSFNKMADDMGNYYKQLQTARDELQLWGTGLEEKVKERTAELKLINQNLALTNVQMEEASRHKSQFLANMSHELRTPLNSIIGYTKLMLDGIEGEINDEQRQDLQTVYSNGKHLLELINDLLDLSRIEAGKTVLNYGTFNIPDLLSEIIPGINQLARSKGLELNYSFTPNMEQLYADKGKIKQTLINLLGNAVKFTKSGSINLIISEEDKFTRFSISDTGIGIKTEDQKTIFDSFMQVESVQTSDYGGTGLGLAISKNLIELQGGKIWVESEYGKGSTFIFIIPRKKIISS
jgi:signal transduction histidine kinase